MNRFLKIRTCQVRTRLPTPKRRILIYVHLGTLSAAVVNGVQSQGIAATIKHFVANDQESERYAAESVLSERALREIYLYPYV